jgi:hypothetical protein
MLNIGLCSARAFKPTHRLRYIAVPDAQPLRLGLRFLGLAGPSWLFFKQPVHEAFVLQRVAVASL